jgi:hypothetical protein
VEADEGSRRSPWILSFLTQALANMVGTLVSAALLGSFAIRIGIIDVSADALNVIALYSYAVIFLVPVTILFAIASTWLLNSIEPARKQSRNRILMLVVQAVLWSGLGAAILFLVTSSIISWDPEGFILYGFQVALFAVSVAAARAYARTRRNRAQSNGK